MLISLEWLQNYVEIKESIPELENTLTMIGQEVEAIEIQGKDLENVVVGQIIEYEKHPEAEKLTLLKVAVGENETLQIVCGAPNHKLGDKVVVAKIGASLPGDFKIKKSKIRGVESQGMLCSEVELGLGTDNSGIIILPETAKIGEEYRKILGLNDVIFELEITPNRPDCLSHIGIAREVAAYYKRNLKYPKDTISEAIERIEEKVGLKVIDKDNCKKYIGKYIKNIEVKESPEWLKKRIISMGLKPINNIVDISNYVMFEYNQPIHIFDADKINGTEVIVRKAIQGEKVITLDGTERVLEEELVIADTNKILCIAGVIGSKSCEVDQNTKNIFIEVAYFNPDNIRKTSKKLGVSTDASYRFERGIDDGNLSTVANRTINLIKQVSEGDVLKGSLTYSGIKHEKVEITLNLQKLNKFVGKKINSEEVALILRSLELEVNIINLENMLVTPPSHRKDLTRPEDLYEEIIRMYGFQNIEDIMPVEDITAGKKDENIELVDVTKDILRKCGLQEVINYSFISKKAVEILGIKEKTIEILNPINEDFLVMRPTLIYSLLANIRDNYNRNQDNLKFCEVSKIFLPAEKLANEEYRVGIAISGKKERTLLNPKPEAYNFYTLKGIVENFFENIGIQKYSLLKTEDKNFHPGRAADVYIGKELIGTFGEIHPDLAEKMDIKKEKALVAEFNLSLMKKYMKNKIKYERIVKYPEVTRDLAVLLNDNILVGNMMEDISKVSPFVEKVNLFDVYKGVNIENGKKSVAISFVLRKKTGTLEENEIKEVVDKILKLIAEKYHGEIRKA